MLVQQLLLQSNWEKDIASYLTLSINGKLLEALPACDERNIMSVAQFICCVEHCNVRFAAFTMSNEFLVMRRLRHECG